MTVALFFHAHTSTREKYETALGCRINYVNSTTSQFSAGYDERTGIARSPLPVLLVKHVPEWRAPEPLVLIGFSAGCWAVRHYLRDAQNRRDITAAIFIDGMHGESQASLGGVLEYARLCQREPEAHRLVVTNSDIDPVTYASTDDGSKWLLDQLGIERERHDHYDGGPGVFVLDDPGHQVTAASHTAHLQRWGVEAIERYVRPFLDAKRDTEPAPAETHPDALDAEPWRDPRISLGERCAILCRSEMDRENPPTAATIARYLSVCERNGKPLGIKTGNHCAGAQSWIAMQCALSGDKLPHLPRAGAKELMDDAVKAGAWLPAADVRAGKRYPHRGDLAIYDRSQPGKPETAWHGHVDRCLGVSATGYDNLGANEGPRGEWLQQTTPWDHSRLLGFVLYPQPTPEPEHPIDDAERERVAGLVALTLHQSTAEGDWSDWR